MAEYSYDAWGKILSITDGSGNDVSTNAAHVANANPFSYRGYYYDIETGLYYVSSRYYDPEVCRFINADELIDNGAGILGNNMFAYCINNPVNMIDVDGYAPKYITEQYGNYKIDGKRMKDISFGFGNIAANGCGVISAYNVLLSRSSKVKFNDVKNGIIWRGGLNAGGLLGVNP